MNQHPLPNLVLRVYTLLSQVFEENSLQGFSSTNFAVAKNHLCDANLRRNDERNTLFFFAEQD